MDEPNLKPGSVDWPLVIPVAVSIILVAALVPGAALK